MDSTNLGSHLSSVTKINTDQVNMLNTNTLSGGILSSAFDGSLYTCLHHIECVERLVVGTGNGSLRLVVIVDRNKKYSNNEIHFAFFF